MNCPKCNSALEKVRYESIESTLSRLPLFDQPLGLGDLLGVISV